MYPSEPSIHLWEHRPYNQSNSTVENGLISAMVFVSAIGYVYFFMLACLHPMQTKCFGLTYIACSVNIYTH